MKLRIGWADGLAIKGDGVSILFDPGPGATADPSTLVFISHAHADHTAGFGLPGIKHSTAATRLIYERLTRRTVKRWVEVSEGMSIKLGDVEVSPLNAGHMLGSVQFKIATPDFTALYTGDINCVDTLTTKRADMEPCDFMIMEATYGVPSFIFPRRDKIYADIVNWSLSQISRGRVPSFHVYSAGKAQEIVKLFNEYTKVQVVCSEPVSRVNAVYGEKGIELNYVKASSPEGLMALRQGRAVFVTSVSSPAPVNASPARATGWALRWGSKDIAAFPLSSHADFRQLTGFVEECRPKAIYVYTGYGEPFSAYLRERLRVEARPIWEALQTKVTEF